MNFQVTDSAGAATALFTGVKANFGMVGLDGSVKRQSCDADATERAKLRNLVDWSTDAGKAAGFVTTARVTHATPSNLYAHSVDRNWEADSHLDARRPDADGCTEDIARQLIYGETGRKIQVARRIGCE